MRSSILLFVAAVMLGACGTFTGNPPGGTGRARPINEGPWTAADQGMQGTWMEPPTEPVPAPATRNQPQFVPE